MSARRTTARFSLAAALVGALALGGFAAPASALGEPDGLYSANTQEGGSIFLQLASWRKHSSKFGCLPGMRKFLDRMSSCGRMISSIRGFGVRRELLAFTGLR